MPASADFLIVHNNMSVQTKAMQSESKQPVLMIWPSVAAWRFEGRLWLDRKFKDGVDANCDRWMGRVRVLMRVDDVAALPPFGAWCWDQSGARFDLEILESGQTLTARHLSGVDVLLASADDYRQLNAADLCRTHGTRCIYIIEYTLRTRLDMTRYAPVSWLRKLKAATWHWRNERRIVRALRAADTIQATGIPAYDAYAYGRSSALLYFDTRLRRDDVVARDALEAKLQALRANGPLRLAFSGRLIKAKGADVMVPLALRLKRLGLAFTLDIFGAGDLSEAIRSEIAAHGLGDAVKLHGAVDFDDVLMPAIKSQVDLFICCHRQGDPSCTYAETLGCGVPIAGFANESLSGLVARHGIGWTVPRDAVGELADLVMRLAANREEICTRSLAAMRFAQEHNYESVFDLRLAHCASVLQA
jgi:glycosyltransferase involved in cell wall biosynthesis